jgi:hypothetical protein
LVWSHVQGALARGDIKMAEVLASMEEVSLAGWRKAIRRCQIDVDFYVLERWDVRRELPWAVLDLGVSQDHLLGELNRAMIQ